MAIEKVMILGNGSPCLAIINALCSPPSPSDARTCKITVHTFPSQTLSLPSHIPRCRVQHTTSDFTRDALQSAFAGHDIVLSTMAGGDSDLQLRIVDAIVAARVQRFVPDEFSHDSLNEQLQARLPKHAARAKVVNHLETLSKTNPDFEWIAVATGYTLDTSLTNGSMGFDMEWHSATVHGAGTEPFAASSLARLGHVVARVLAHWETVKNQYIYAAGTVTSANEVLKAAENVTGHEFAVGNHDVEECIQEGRKRIQRGYPDTGIFLLERSVLYDKQLGAVAPFQTRSANELLSLAPESVEDIVATAYHDLKHLGKPGCGCSA